MTDKSFIQELSELDDEIRKDERQAVLAEVEGWADENQMSPFANLGSTKYVRYAKLRAKLEEMKEGNDAR